MTRNRRAGLKKRVEVILSYRPATKLNSARKCLLAASAAIAIASTVLAWDGDHFLSRLSGQQNVELYPESSNKFFATVVAAQLSFVTDAQGRATELVLHQGGFEQHARRIDEADAKSLEATREVRIANKTPSPGTEESLRRFIDSMQSGQPNYDEMSPLLAAANRSQVSRTGPLMKSLGALQSLTFRTVNAQGMDVYDANFEQGRVEFSISPLTSDGKVTARAWHKL
jgi:hypothetical protein